MSYNPLAQQQSPPTLSQIETLLRQVEAIPQCGDFRVDQALGLARDRLLMMWAEARRAADAALDAANLPPDEVRPSDEYNETGRFAWEHLLPQR